MLHLLKESPTCSVPEPAVAPIVAGVVNFLPQPEKKHSINASDAKENWQDLHLV
jgi:hypothetical protein